MRQQVGPQVGHALGTKAVQVVEDSREVELPKGHLRVVEHRAVARLAVAQLLFDPVAPDRQGLEQGTLPVLRGVLAKDVHRAQDRSEESRVGKECVSTCRSRWAPYP